GVLLGSYYFGGCGFGGGAGGGPAPAGFYIWGGATGRAGGGAARRTAWISVAPAARTHAVRRRCTRRSGG
ncbi:hypothetical protein EJ577_11905, partial [Pseudomonas aeruginosa]